MANPDLQIRGGGGGGGGGGGHLDPDIRRGGGVSFKNFLGALRAAVWSKHEGDPARALPLDPPPQKRRI